MSEPTGASVASVLADLQGRMVAAVADYEAEADRVAALGENVNLHVYLRGERSGILHALDLLDEVARATPSDDSEVKPS